MDFTTEYTREYQERRDRFRETFPAAHRFMLALEALCAEDPRFHLGVDKNLFIYCGDAFLAHMTMEKVKTETPHLVFTPNTKVNIKPGTTQHVDLVFPRGMSQLIMPLGGFHKWAEKNKNRPTDFIIRSTAPDAFFEGMIKLLRTMPDRLAPSSTASAAP